MDKYYFSELSQLQKIDFIWNYGEIIHEIESHQFYYSLFLFCNFFVEVKLHKQCNEIVSILIQQDPECLYKYVANIDLDLFQLG